MMLQNADRFNTAFGGVTPRASNAIYVHGQLDPWRTVGVQVDDNDNSTIVIVIEGIVSIDFYIFNEFLYYCCENQTEKKFFFP